MENAWQRINFKIIRTRHLRIQKKKKKEVEGHWNPRGVVKWIMGQIRSVNMTRCKMAFDDKIKRNLRVQDHTRKKGQETVYCVYICTYMWPKSWYEIFSLSKMRLKNQATSTPLREIPFSSLVIIFHCSLCYIYIFIIYFIPYI